MYINDEEEVIREYDGKDDKDSLEAWLKEQMKSLIYDFKEENQGAIF